MAPFKAGKRGREADAGARADAGGESLRHAVLPLFKRSRGWRSQPGAAVKGEVKPAAYPSPYRPGRADGLTRAASVGEAAVRQPADEPPTTASGRNLVGGEMNRDRAEAAVTPLRQSRFREKPRKGPAGKRRQAGSPARVGPTTCIRPAAGLRTHRRQPKGRAGAIWRRRSQGNRNRSFGPAYAAAATTLRPSWHRRACSAPFPAGPCPAQGAGRA